MQAPSTEELLDCAKYAIDNVGGRIWRDYLPFRGLSDTEISNRVYQARLLMVAKMKEENAQHH